jgi:ligand-binding SRPBCC domain-containing protein
MILLETRIAADVERCFELSLSVDLHIGSMERSGERAVAGVTSGGMLLGDTVTWEARHLGIRQRLTTGITLYERPWRFIDEQLRGPFRHFRHTHVFTPLPDGTLMLDAFEYNVPCGLLGRLVDALFLRRYMHALLTQRNVYLKQAAESLAALDGSE